MEKQLTLINKTEQITLLAEFVDQICEELNLDMTLNFNLNLVLEEAVTNVIMYAYPQDEEHTLTVRAWTEGDKLAFEVCKQLFNLNCQVFTSSHNTYLMTNDLLRPDCNFILQNNKIKPLHACTEKELRFGHNIEKLFRAGAFEV